MLVFFLITLFALLALLWAARGADPRTPEERIAAVAARREQHGPPDLGYLGLVVVIVVVLGVTGLWVFAPAVAFAYLLYRMYK
jgi:hypothetical protein